MMQFLILCVGSIKEKYLSDGINEYIKRIQKYAKIDIVEIPESRLSEHPSPKQIISALEEEATNIFNKISESSFIITLEIGGTQLSSDDLAKLIDKSVTYESSKLVFVIGSSYGLSETLKAKSQYKLSFSAMTFPHQLMRLIALEQIYRALTILNHTQYHK